MRSSFVHKKKKLKIKVFSGICWVLSTPTIYFSVLSAKTLCATVSLCIFFHFLEFNVTTIHRKLVATHLSIHKKKMNRLSPTGKNSKVWLLKISSSLSTTLPSNAPLIYKVFTRVTRLINLLYLQLCSGIHSAQWLFCIAYTHSDNECSTAHRR